MGTLLVTLEAVAMLDRLIEMAKEKQEMFKHLRNVLLVKYKKNESRTTKKYTKRGRRG